MSQYVLSFILITTVFFAIYPFTNLGRILIGLPFLMCGRCGSHKAWGRQVKSLGANRDGDQVSKFGVTCCSCRKVSVREIAFEFES